jgi:predicted nuclease with TOPRIM domain
MEELFDTLTRFYKTLIEPDLKEIKRKLDNHDAKLSDFLGHFDHIYKKLKTLETEYYAILEGLKRIEGKLDIREEGKGFWRIRLSS